ncbi:MAG: septum formation inhibitor Maf [Pseudomonadales bacterium]|nr:septum formation inhibitor Maf [Halioglobus sp.]MCP5122361.1 septum formation inhibitor Maf [Pseudomonadales bacterium]MCP5191529.1 septum formation inhibitor Maf [Pseudomonadales bacterium]
MSAPQLVLASASPRRRELLDQLGARYTCDPAAIDESGRPGEPAAKYVARIAREKALRVAARYPGNSHAVLAADTAVVVDGEVLGKPRDHFDGLDILARLSGRSHLVLTAVCLARAGKLSAELVETCVEFITLTPQLCETYLATDEPWDKAGAYAIQGLAGAFVRSIRGSYSNVVGLPLCETWQLLNAHGIATRLAPARD